MAAAKSSGGSSGGGRLLLFAGAAIALSFAPVLSVALEWFETFFHELSHGLAALATGGSIRQIELAIDGSGLIRHSGSALPALVTFAGYPGAILCGALIYCVASASHRASADWAIGLGAVVALTLLFWVRDFVSAAIGLALFAAFFAIWRWPEARIAQAALQLVGAYLMTSGVQSVWGLISHSGESDATILANQTYVPAFVWPIVWLGCGVAVLIFVWRREARG